MDLRNWMSCRPIIVLASTLAMITLLVGCSVGTATSSLCEANEDCAAPEECVNGLCRRVCSDNAQCLATQHCTGGFCVANDAVDPCSPTDPPRACTPLSVSLWDLAGIGTCHLGTQRCLNSGTWETACDGGVPVAEVADNNLDDDCDGVVDEGSTCAPSGSTRPCFLGLPPDQVAAALKGECVAGAQQCEADPTNGDRWGVTCLGEVRPQRAAVDGGLGSGGIGFEFAELAGSDVSTSQCDGIDNDCDGRYDEEPWFDADADGYTVCGTTFTPDPLTPATNTFATGGTSSEYIDCDDNDNTVTPGAYFGYDLAGTCSHCLPALLASCDPLVATCLSETARPTCTVPDAGTCAGTIAPRWSAAPLGEDPFGDCTALGLGCCLVAGEPACCPASGTPCTTGSECATTFCVEGVCCDSACDEACDSCRWTLNGVANGSCLPLALQAEDTAPSNLCTTAGDGCAATSCQCGPASSVCLAADGQSCLANTDCASNQCECANATCSAKVCSAVTCSCKYNADGDDNCEGNLTDGVDDADDTCGALSCNGSGTCNLDNGSVCASNITCETNQCECANATCSTKMCSAVSCNCTFTNGATCAGYIADGEDDADNSCGAFTCNGSGACNLANGVTCTSNVTCESNQCECANASCSTKVCSAVDCSCTYSNGTTCASFMSDGVDDADDTCGTTLTCNGSGGCNVASGGFCTSDLGCESNQCECANASCSTKMCSAEDCNCMYTNGTTCAGNIADGTDDADDTCSTTLTCNGSGACNLANGVTCTSNIVCESNECECANATCSLKVCSAIDCGTCRYNATGDSTCEANIADGYDDADNACGTLSCNGSAACNLANGVTCTTNNSCESNECECANATCASKACSAVDCSCTFTNGTTCTGNYIDDARDDADNTCGTRTCDGAGACHVANGTACASAAVCESNFCVDGYCCNTACDSTCYSCAASLTASGNGTCAVFNMQQTDTAPIELCTSTGVGCQPGTSCQCAPNLGLCKKAPGQACAAGTECASGVCSATNLCQ